MRHFFLASVMVCAAASAEAQLSSDFPGVPRAAISVNGSTQGRNAFTLTGFKVPGATGAGDTLAGGLRYAFGQSYRIASDFEIGFDVTLFDASGLQPPTAASTGTTAPKSGDTYIRALTGYGFRVGGKWRPVLALDPDGNGYQLAIGGGYQPAVKALWGIEKLGDSTRTGGQFNGQKTLTNTIFRTNPFAKVSANTMLGVMGSYRSKRIMADAALMSETVTDNAVGEDPSPLGIFKGVSPRVGASFKLTPGFAVGASYWGSGSPPWYDQISNGMPGKLKNENFGFLLQLGSDPESGIDIVYSSPTGKWGEAGRLYFRSRSTH